VARVEHESLAAAYSDQTFARPAGVYAGVEALALGGNSPEVADSSHPDQLVAGCPDQSKGGVRVQLDDKVQVASAVAADGQDGSHRM
jgi:hypothetical protein